VKRPSHLALVVLVLAGCRSPSVADTTVALDEFSVTPGVDRLTAGTINLTVSNSGEFPHTLVVSDGAGTVVAGTTLILPGEGATLSVDLEPGLYMFTCRIVGQSDSGEIIDHYERGMAARVEVGSY